MGKTRKIWLFLLTNRRRRAIISVKVNALQARLPPVFFLSALRLSGRGKFEIGGGRGLAKNLEIALLFDFYGEMLTDKQRDVVELYYNDDLSLSEIAENEGITRQGVRDSIKRAETQLTEMEERLGLVRRFGEMREKLEEIRQAVRDIQEINERCGFSREIGDRTRRILELSEGLAD